MVTIYDIDGNLIKEFPELETLVWADLSYEDLRYADFREMDLTGADFSGTCFEYHCAVGSGARRERGIKT